MSTASLEINRLVVRAGRRCLLEVEGLRAAAGRVVALMGPNGAGKSTLLRACLGLAKADLCDIRVLGEKVSALRGAALAGLRRRVGYVPQMLPARSELPLTVREVAVIGRTASAGLFRPLSAHDWRVVDEWLERLGLSSLAHCPFSQLSGGEQRKTILARAMTQQPELLLLDEPTANLDLGWREQIVQIIEDLYHATRMSVVLVCHELEVLPASCHQVILLEGGRLSAVGSPETVFTSERVARLYGAGFQVVHPGGRHALLPGGGL